MRVVAGLAILISILGCGSAAERAAPTPLPSGLPRVAVELAIDPTGGAQASLVRLLCYLDQLDLQALVVRGGSTVDVGRLLDAYAAARPGWSRAGLALPPREWVRSRLLMGDTSEAAIAAVVSAIDGGSLWYLRWTDGNPGSPLLSRALDRVRDTRASEDYRRAAAGVRFVGSTGDLGDHGRALGLVLDTTGDGARAAAALVAAGSEVDRLVNTHRGSLGAFHPAGVSELGADTFLGLLAASPGVPDQPDWGGWGGRFEPHPNGWSGWWRPASADASGDGNPIDPFGRWGAAIQGDFLARLLWSDAGPAEHINHPPDIVVNGDKGNLPLLVSVAPDDTVTLTAAGSSDRDGDQLRFAWIAYPEAGTYAGNIAIQDPTAMTVSFPIDTDFTEGRSFHIVLQVTDNGSPPLVRYRRVVLHRRALSPWTTSPAVPGGPPAGRNFVVKVWPGGWLKGRRR